MLYASVKLIVCRMGFVLFKVRLNIVQRMLIVVYGVVQATAFLAFKSLSSDEIAYVNHVAQLADVFGWLDAFEQMLCLFIEEVEAFPCSVEAQVGADYSDVGRHDLSHFLYVLGYEHFLLIGHCALIIPFWHSVVEFILVDYFK